MHIKRSQPFTTNHLLIARLPYFWLQGRILLVVFIAGALSACQPPSNAESLTTSENTDSASSPIGISDDTVIMAPEYILSLKPTRYQPSLGLQGQIEAIKSIQLTAAHDLQIQKVLVTDGQWVEEGTPLFIVQRQTDNISQTTSQIDPTLATHKDSNKNFEDANRSSLLAKPSDASTNDVDPTAAAANSASDDVTNNTVNKTTNSLESKPNVIKDAAAPITVRARFSGRVNNLYSDRALTTVPAGEALVKLSDDRHLRFIATLPIQAKSQLSIGQNVNFTATDLTEKFTGQVSKLTVNQAANQLLVHVHVVKNEASRGKLRPDMIVSGRVDYGQIEVGTIVPEHAIHDADLSELKKPPYKPLSALTASVWIIKQDQRLTRQTIEVIEYNPSTNQYLIAGVRNDSLVCLADLPLNSAGKKAVISS